MLVFIHDNFKLDLTYLKVTFLEQNSWFQDDLSTEFSFPFDLYIDSDISRNSGFEAHYNSIKKQKTFLGYLDIDGDIVDAVLTFSGKKGKLISAVINSGIVGFPSFDMKLEELPLEQKAVPDIIDDALAVIFRSYPETNYNFPPVHTDKYDPTTDDWNGFGKIINQFKAGTFVKNELVPETNLDKINNIMQPLPYLMHVVQKAVNYAGYTLAGDILNDYEFNHALIFKDDDYYTRTTLEDVSLTYKNNEWNSEAYVKSDFTHVLFDKSVTIQNKGNYTLLGSAYCLRYRYKDYFGSSHNASDVSLKIYKNTTQIYNLDISGDNRGSSKYTDNFTQEIDLDLELNAGDVIRIVKIEPRRDLDPSPTEDYPEAISLKLIPSRYLTADGTPIISVQNLKEINLNRLVPDMTVKDLITVLKNWHNYDFTTIGKVVYMNLIESKLDRAAAIDLRDFEIEEPEEVFHEDREFELSFADGLADTVYRYDFAIINKEGITINGASKNSDLKQIKIDALPLPVIFRNGITTAYNFNDEPSKLRIVFMRPIAPGGTPVCYHNANVLIPNVAQTKFKNWLDFRINSSSFRWDFIISAEKFKAIKIQTLIYAYDNYHVLDEIERERIDDLWWRITAKTESL
ncbi:hypothetical protein [Flavobacterium sp. 14A]|uniref:hypothetical protein n=1 Tax=Flavobacterium sp. 14A TaxID=2735896 RepID=UPI00156EC403|nr:hypothetical protein [Flavobacterium sp. 14A]NRT11547.1 hypothetical protein [Flavobacterium sp. 14A]